MLPTAPRTPGETPTPLDEALGLHRGTKEMEFTVVVLAALALPAEIKRPGRLGALVLSAGSSVVQVEGSKGSNTSGAGGYRMLGMDSYTAAWYPHGFADGSSFPYAIPTKSKASSVDIKRAAHRSRSLQPRLRLLLLLEGVLS
ncbi:hypothetical protein BDN71DRAFT_1436967 [Pleurotus eryngii]|uniref:Uncharacterized protein n=1 Tax=Pleurotus eryngii TaxID=5323 RepID=A0A9P6D906_PLEER|nr:hypothetical protein BDN71DRAFT_1436967 [Pleurotus eryngii]